jgi:hypothetical protein
MVIGVQAKDVSVFFGHGYSLRRGSLCAEKGEIVSTSRCWRGLAVASLGILRRTTIGVQETFRKMNGATQKASENRP